MPLSREEVNPLSALGIRKLSFIPNHFSKITVNEDVDIKIIDHWINYNLNSRYAIIQKLRLDNENKIVENIEIGIEDPKEVIMLTLGCSQLHR
jgi:hypothetical protein